MSNHARGLWGYYGSTAAGGALTIQSTGIGGPSAALVLGDLVELGVKRAVRVGTCVGLDADCELGDLLIVGGAIAAGGSAAALGVEPGATVDPDRELSERLLREFGGERTASTIVSIDGHPTEASPQSGSVAADMQTAPLLAKARSLQVEAAAVLIVSECVTGAETLKKERLEDLEKRAGKAAASILSS
ncbi:MAG: uridine phosphorylase [Solirubrobacterales bacterium]|nr:uridine phosphorylase [Solirubrobacterales bacterium]